MFIELRDQQAEVKTAEGQFAPSLRPWVGGPDRAPPVGEGSGTERFASTSDPPETLPAE